MVNIYDEQECKNKINDKHRQHKTLSIEQECENNNNKIEYKHHEEHVMRKNVRIRFDNGKHHEQECKEKDYEQECKE